MAKVFTWQVAMKQTPMLVQTAINSLAFPPWGLRLLVMADLLVVGCIMETTAALILLVPVLAAIALLIACYWPPLTTWFPSLIYT